MKVAKKEFSIHYVLGQICKDRRAITNSLLLVTGIHIGQDTLLNELGKEDGQTISSLVQKLDIQYATLSVMITRMEETFMIVKRSSGSDKRASLIFLTEAGRVALKQVFKVWKLMGKKTLKGLSVSQQLQLQLLLLQVQSNLKV